MPPRWPRRPDRRDPAYRRLDDRMNFAIHVAIFALCNSGVWFFRLLGELPGSGVSLWPWAPWLTLSWVGLLLIHGIYIFAIADYSFPYDPDESVAESQSDSTS